MNLYTQLLDEFRKNKPLALATIIEKSGSAPQISGVSALFSLEGLIAGTIGGGILEADAREKAAKSLQQSTSIIYKFSLISNIYSTEGAICGGEVTILIDASPQDHIKVFQNIAKSLDQCQPGALATFIEKQAEGNISINRHWIKMGENFDFDSEAPYIRFSEQIRKSLMDNKPDLIRTDDTLLFLEPMYTLPRLVIAGAGHVGQAVCHMGKLLDFQVIVIDDRPEFANKEKIPEADNIIVGEMGEAMQNIPISPDTYIVIVTRGHQKDAEALKPCINSKAAYVGMIGSSRKIAVMREKFLQEGWATSAEWDRIYAPIGIDIQSKTVQEIAVSIAAQLVLVRRQKQIGVRGDV